MGGGGDHLYGHQGNDGLYPPGGLYTPYQQQPPPPAGGGTYPPPAAYPPPPPHSVDRAFELPTSHYPPPPAPGGGGYSPPDPGHHHHHRHYHDDPYQHHEHEHHRHHDDPHHDVVAERVPPRPRGQTVKLHCLANTDFNLAVRHDGVVLAPANPADESQQWIKDMSWSTTVRDEKGYPAFMLVNKATNKALKHAPGESQQVLLDDYVPGALDETLLWSQSEDMGKGFTTIRSANNIKLNLDAFKGDKKSGGVKDGTPAILFKWKKQDNQLWKMVPLS